MACERLDGAWCEDGTCSICQLEAEVERLTSLMTIHRAGEGSAIVALRRAEADVEALRAERDEWKIHHDDARDGWAASAEHLRAAEQEVAALRLLLRQRDDGIDRLNARLEAAESLLAEAVGVVEEFVRDVHRYPADDLGGLEAKAKALLAKVRP
jgi:chromosome segregation ATPase